MRTEKFIKRGIYHTVKGEECQDHVMLYDNGRYIIAAAADGATVCRHGLEGAKAACMAVKNFFETEGEDVFRCSRENISFLLLEHVRFFLKGMFPDDRNDIRSYASTLLALFIDKYNGQSLMLNLGDGAILSADEKSFRTMLAPRKRSGQPCLTTHFMAYKCAEVRETYLAFGESYILCTDGFISALRNNMHLHQLMKKGRYAELNRYLSDIDEADDIGYIMVMRS